MSASQRKKWIVGLSILITLTVLIGALWAARTHELLEHATRITDGALRSYVWQSPNKLVMQIQTGELEQHDLTTGLRTLGAFTAPATPTTVWRASSDGLHLLTFDDSSNFSVVEQSNTGGSSPSATRRFQTEGWGSGEAASKHPGIAWLPDGRRWLSWAPLQDKKPLQLHSIDTPDGHALTLASPAAMTALIGVTPDQLVVQADAPPPPIMAKQITVATFGLYPNRAPVHLISFPLPTSAQVKDLELAPQGDRLAWLFVDARRSPLVTMLIRVFPTMAARFPPTEGISVWVSRRDGTEMREIGFQQTKTSGKETNVATDLRWMPDGKHLSFLMNDALYSVPAP